MNTTKIITIICWLVTAVVLTGLVIWLLTGNLFGFNTGFKISNTHIGIGSLENLTGTFSEVGTKEIPVSDISSISVDWVAGSLTITPYDGSTIKLAEYARRELKDDEQLVFKTNGNKLDIRYASPRLSVSLPEKKLEIQVPQKLASQLKLLEVTSSSAALQVTGLNVSILNIDETSGLTQLSSIKADETRINSVSGLIDITGLTSSSLTAGTVSGEIRLTSVTADTLKTSTTSGSQNLNGTFKDLDTGSISGEIRITGTIDPESVSCETVSGAISLTIPAQLIPEISYSTVSGRFTCVIPAKIVSGSASFFFKTVSGSITISAA